MARITATHCACGQLLCAPTSIKRQYCEHCRLNHPENRGNATKPEDITEHPLCSHRWCEQCQVNHWNSKLHQESSDAT